MPRVNRPLLATAIAGSLLSLMAATASADEAADRKYCESLQDVARTVCLRDVDKAAVAATKPAAEAEAAIKQPINPDGKPYKVVGGTKVDAFTLEGFHTWRSAACDRCHGANQEGLVGPSLVNSLKTLTKDEFITTVKNGRLEKGMPSFGQNPTVASHYDALYAYLKGRSDGAITKAKVEPLQ